jgi:hypothetical protein
MGVSESSLNGNAFTAAPRAFREFLRIASMNARLHLIRVGIIPIAFSKHGPIVAAFDLNDATWFVFNVL